MENVAVNVSEWCVCSAVICPGCIPEQYAGDATVALMTLYSNK